MKLTEIKSSGAVATSVADDTLMLVTSDPDTAPVSEVITVADLRKSFNKTGANGLALMPSATPANSAITVSKSVMFHDNNYLYVAVDNNLLKRVELAAF